MQKWEYKMIGPPFGSTMSMLNDLGEAGWELITVIHDKDYNLYYFLKRPLTGNRFSEATFVTSPDDGRPNDREEE